MTRRIKNKKPRVRELREYWTEHTLRVLAQHGITNPYMSNGWETRGTSHKYYTMHLDLPEKGNRQLFAKLKEFGWDIVRKYKPLVDRLDSTKYAGYSMIVQLRLIYFESWDNTNAHKEAGFEL